MNIIFLTVGKKTDPSFSSAVEDYTTRISRHLPTSWTLIPSSDMVAEGVAILKKIGKGDFVVALDEKGKEMSTTKLADFVNTRMVSGIKNLIFVIGGAYGLDKAVLERADMTWSLSQLTFPHQLVRLVLAESIYRAISVIKNEPYHHV